MLLAGGVPPGFVYGRTASAGGANFPPSNPNLPVSSNGTVLWSISDCTGTAHVPAQVYPHLAPLVFLLFCTPAPSLPFWFVRPFSFLFSPWPLPSSSFFLVAPSTHRSLSAVSADSDPDPESSSAPGGLSPALSHPRGVGCFAERVSTLANPSNFWYRSRRLRSRLLPIGFLLRSLPSKRALAPKSPPTFQNTVHRRTLFDRTFLLGCFSYLTIIFLCSYCFVLFCLFFSFC
jgi:hypothetical protein